MPALEIASSRSTSSSCLTSIPIRASCDLCSSCAFSSFSIRSLFSDISALIKTSDLVSSTLSIWPCPAAWADAVGVRAGAGREARPAAGAAGGAGGGGGGGCLPLSPSCPLVAGRGREGTAWAETGVGGLYRGWSPAQILSRRWMILS